MTEKALGPIFGRRLLLLAALIAGSAVPLRAQAPAASPPPGPGEELTVWLMTMGPGEYVWERFGHNAIRIRDDRRGTDVAYNYGMFSFEQEGFVLRFIQGRMDYWMEAFDSELTAQAYIRADRSVWLQELNLTPGQRAELRDFLEWNALPENRIYRYDYYRDNCSTRVRDAIDRVLGGQIREQTGEVGAATTFRDHTARLTADDPPIFTGLMAGLGQPVDREISVWDEMFLPLEMRERIRQVTVVDRSGASVPLVRAEQEVYRAEAAAASSQTMPGTSPYLVIGLLLGGLLWGAGRESSRRRIARNTFRLVGTIWAVVAGTLGLVLLGLWLFTDHATSYRNENLFFFDPLLIPLIAVLPAAAGRGVRARPAAFGLAAAVALISVLGFVLQVLPAFFQVNGALIAIGLPANLGLALGTREITRIGAQEVATRDRSGGPAQHRQKVPSRIADNG